MSLKELFDPSKQESTESKSSILSLMGGGSNKPAATNNSTSSYKPATNNSTSNKTSTPNVPPPTAVSIIRLRITFIFTYYFNSFIRKLCIRY